MRLCAGRELVRGGLERRADLSPTEDWSDHATPALRSHALHPLGHQRWAGFQRSPLLDISGRCGTCDVGRKGGFPGPWDFGSLCTLGLAWGPLLVLLKPCICDGRWCQRSCWSTSLAETIPTHGKASIASQKHSKKEGSLRDLFAKTPAKKTPPAITARLNRAQRTKRQQLEDDIQTLEATHGRSGSLVTQRQIATLRKQLHALDGYRAEYALLRTKQRHYAGGDRARHLLAHRLREQAAGRRVAELQLPDDTRTCREEQIVAQFELFYSDLYAEQGLDGEGVEGYLISIPLSQISLTASETLDGDIIIAEVTTAILIEP
ncbi:hypothetical protein NDU88_006860 [Pleurodeles waltl]|uniref:Uncharacterized protein n=1 Tax=Pleurodeles waltl TaxID=8319 RepID=A0AAV7SR56_PLEWA|nr:hypothetical protein NDU88_006860 [Pleurodeles waltl]